MEREEWKDIANYEGLYKVSNFGRVKSLNRIIIKHGLERKYKGVMLRQTTSIKGYNRVRLSKNGSGDTRMVHHLIAIAFHNYTRYAELIVDHKDNNKLNNRSDNLQIITRRLNCSKDRKNGTSKYTGISWNKHNAKWIAQIRLNGQPKNLGYFDNEIDASNAYQRVLTKHNNK